MLITPTASASVIIAIMRQAEPVTTKRNQTLYQYLRTGIAKIGLLKIKKTERDANSVSHAQGVG